MKNLYQQILNKSPFGYSYQKLIYDADDKPIDYIYIETNPAFDKIFGYTKNDVIGKKASELELGSDFYSLELLEKISNIASNGGIFQFVTSSINKDQELVVDVESLDKDYFIMTFQDNTETIQQKKIYENLIESEEKFKSLFDKAPLAYQSLDINGNFIDVNEKWINLLGYTREEVIGKWFGDFLVKKYQKSFREKFPLFKKNGFFQSEFEMIHKNGDILSTAFDGKIGTNEKGEFKQTHCILKDITKEKKCRKI